MAINTQVYQLDIVPNGAPLVVNVHQGDLTQRVLTFQLYSSNGTLTIPSGATASIEGTKPDGNAFAYAASISGTTVTATVRAQMVALAGDIPTQIKVLSGSSPVYAANFILRVQEDVTANADVSDTEIPSLVVQAQAAAQAAEQAAQDIDANWFINGVKTTPIDTYTTTSKLTDGAINELKGSTDTNAALIAALKTPITPSPTDMNDTSLFGYTALLTGGSVLNLPTSSAGSYYRVLCLGTWQIASRYASSGDSRMYQRVYANREWNNWSIVADDGNTNAGSFTYENCTGSNVSLRRFGRNVVFQATLNMTADIPAGGGGEGFVIFPQGFRPAAGFGFVGQVGQGTRAFYISSSGKVQVAGTETISNGTVVRISGSFYQGN